MLGPGCCSALDPEGSLHSLNAGPTPCPATLYSTHCTPLPFMATKVPNIALLGAQSAKHCHIWHPDHQTLLCLGPGPPNTAMAATQTVRYGHAAMSYTRTAKYCHVRHPGGPGALRGAHCRSQQGARPGTILGTEGLRGDTHYRMGAVRWGITSRGRGRKRHAHGLEACQG